MALTTEKLRELRDWFNLLLTGLTVLIIPITLLVLKNQRLELKQEIQREYVSQEVFKSDHDALAAKNLALSADLLAINVKLDRLQISVVRLMDAVKLQDKQP